MENPKKVGISDGEKTQTRRGAAGHAEIIALGRLLRVPVSNYDYEAVEVLRQEVGRFLQLLGLGFRHSPASKIPRQEVASAKLRPRKPNLPGSAYLASPKLL